MSMSAAAELVSGRQMQQSRDREGAKTDGEMPEKDAVVRRRPIRGAHAKNHRALFQILVESRGFQSC